MPTSTDVIKGSLVVQGMLEDKCFESVKDFILALPNILAVELPSSISNVTVGNVQPADYERDNLWIRKDNDGGFIGIYVFAKKNWQQIFPVPGQLTLIVGDSRSVPEGYTFAEDLTDLTTDQKAVLKKGWHVGGTTPAVWYDLFHVRFTGF